MRPVETRAYGGAISRAISAEAHEAVNAIAHLVVSYFESSRFTSLDL